MASEQASFLGETGQLVRAVGRAMGVTFKNLLRRPITVRYPTVKRVYPDRFRGILALTYDPQTGEENCIGCRLCEYICPPQVIKVEMLKAEKRNFAKTFTLELYACEFCELCVQVCPTDAIIMMKSFDLATADRREPRGRAHPEPVPRGALARRRPRGHRRRVPAARLAVPLRRPAAALRGRCRHHRRLRDHAHRAPGGRVHPTNQPVHLQRRRAGGRRLRRPPRLSAAGGRRRAAGRHRRSAPRPGPGAGRALRGTAPAPRRAAGDRAPRRALLRADGGLTVPLHAYLILAALVFAIGLFGVLTRKNAVGILLGIALTLHAVNVNLVAFSRFRDDLAGLIFTLFTIAITVAEVAVGLAIVIVIFRVRRTIEADHLDLLRG